MMDIHEQTLGLFDKRFTSEHLCPFCGCDVTELIQGHDPHGGNHVGRVTFFSECGAIARVSMSRMGIKVDMALGQNVLPILHRDWHEKELQLIGGDMEYFSLLFAHGLQEVDR